jgi:hypothetical protein
VFVCPVLVDILEEAAAVSLKTCNFYTCHSSTSFASGRRSASIAGGPISVAARTSR